MMTPNETCPAGQWGETFPCMPIKNGLLDDNKHVPVWTARSGWTSEYVVPGETQRSPDDGAEFPIMLHGSPDSQNYEMTRENAGQMIPNRIAVNNGEGMSERVVADISESVSDVHENFVDAVFIPPCMRSGGCPCMRGGMCGCRGGHRMIVFVIVLYLFVMMAFRMKYPKNFMKMSRGIMIGFAILLGYYYLVQIWMMPGMDMVGKMIWALLLVLFYLLVQSF